MHLKFAAAILSSVAIVLPAKAQDSGSVELVYVEWADSAATTNVIAAVLEDQGYSVTITPLTGAAMWQAVASGEADAHVTGAVPITHAAYVERLGDQIEILEPNIRGARIGLAVPAYVEIDSIEEIAADPSVIGGRIVGIDPGAGMMPITEEVISEYGLDIPLVEGSDATMTAALQDAISREEPVAVTAWTPHWKFSRWDLKYLDDPKDIFGGEQTINNVVRLGLSDDMPDVYRIISNFELSLGALEEIMLAGEEDGDPAAAARTWISANPDIVAEWTQG